MRDAVLIYNPRAGRWQAKNQLGSVVDALAAGGYRAEALATAGPGDATSLAREAAATGFEFVFVLGGDGTLREATAGLLGSTAALGPLPAGTGNIIAKALGIPPDPLAAAQGVARARARPVRVGLCAGEPFLMQASAGLDAQALAWIPPALKRHLGTGAVTLAAVREWWRYDYPRISLTANGSRFDATFCAACNIPQYGPFRLAPPDAADGRLTVVAFTGAGRAQTLAFALDLARDRHLERPDVSVLRTDSVTFEGPAGLRLQLDGCVSSLAPPVTAKIATAPLLVLTPGTPEA